MSFQPPSLLYHPPILDYSGLTIVLSNPSRFDINRLISGPAEKLLTESLKPSTRFHCDIRLLNEPTSFLPKTKVVLLMGDKAQKAYIENLTLNESRGYCYPKGAISNPLTYLTTYHPQDCLDRKNYSSGDDSDFDDDEDDPESGKEKEHSPTKRKNYKFWFYQDLRKSLDICQNGLKLKLPWVNFQIYLSSTEICFLLKSFVNKNVFFDIETNENYNITVFSFSTDSKTIYTVPCLRHDGTPAYDNLQLSKIFQALSICFARNRIVIHNSLFDLLILCWRYKIIPPTDIYDTMISWHRLNPEAEKSLGHVLSVVGHEEYHKNENCFNPHNQQQEQKLWRYNAKDVFGLAIAYEWIVNETKKSQLETSIQNANNMVRPYLLQSLQGIKIDEKLREEKFQEIEKLKIQYHRIAKLLIGYDIGTLGSWQRISKYLYEFKKIPRPNPKWENGKIVYKDLTASATLYKLLCKRDIPFLKLLLHYRSIAKEAGFFKFISWGNNRFTTSYNIAGTDTYRLASRALLQTWGSNSQNIKKKQRKILIADEGKILVQTDQSGAEALFVAYLAPNGNYRKLMESGIKIHVFIALHVFKDVWRDLLKINIEPFIKADPKDLYKVEGWKAVESLIKKSDEWEASRRYYYIAKMICHAANYGMKAPTFQINVLKKSEGKIVVSLQQANFYLGTYHFLFPEIRQWQDSVVKQLEKDRTLYNCFGDRRIFHGQWDDSLFKQAYAFVPQSSVGVLTSLAISEIQKQIDLRNPEYEGIDILINGHDAIGSQITEGEHERLGRIQERHINKIITLQNGNVFQMKSESSWGKNFCEMERIKYAA